MDGGFTSVSASDRLGMLDWKAYDGLHMCGPESMEFTHFLLLSKALVKRLRASIAQLAVVKASRNIFFSDRKSVV